MRYESLLEAHGEKIERIEELELDLADVKKLFREQVSLFVFERRGKERGSVKMKKHLLSEH